MISITCLRMTQLFPNETFQTTGCPLLVFLMGRGSHPLSGLHRLCRSLFRAEIFGFPGPAPLFSGSPWGIPCAGSMGGFLISFAAALLLGSLAFWHSWLKILLEPAVLLLKSVPVASFVVLLLILMGSKNLSTAIVILTSFPMLYTGVLSGLSQTDPKLLEMAQVFDMNPLKECLFLYRPALLPFLTGSSQTALGMSWKSGTAAEIIGVPAHSIGEQLYMSKIYLNTASLFAWTTMIILLSLVFEKLFLYLLKKAAGKTWEDSYADPKPL